MVGEVVGDEVGCARRPRQPSGQEAFNAAGSRLALGNKPI